MTAFDPERSRNVGEIAGFERLARAAARVVEDTRFVAIKGSPLDRPVLKRNAYEMAKAGE